MQNLNMIENNRILIVTDVFPPNTGAGTKRIVKFCKYLPKYGWIPRILAPQNLSTADTNYANTKDIPLNTVVHRTPTLEVFYKSSTPTNQNTAAKSSTKGFFKRALSTLHIALGKYLKVPDSRVLWIPGAIAYSLSLVPSCRVIMATGPSFSNMLVGYILSVLYGKPLVLDFRDAWIADPTLRFENVHLKNVNSLLEKIVVEAADLVITTNPFVTRDFATRFPHNDTSKYLTIYNGFDCDDQRGTNGSKSVNKKLLFVHTGRLYGERSPISFLRGLRVAFDKDPGIRDMISVIFVGKAELFSDGNNILQYIEQLSLASNVSVIDSVSRERSLEYQSDADILLAIIGSTPQGSSFTYGIAGKIFDYLLHGKEILTIADSGATSWFVSEFGIGKVYSNDEITNIADYIIAKANRARAIKEPGDTVRSKYSRFNVENQTRTLAACLDKYLKT